MTTVVEHDNLLYLAQLMLVTKTQECQQMQQRLREQEQQISLLSDNTSNLIAKTTPDGTYLYVSPSCKALLGYNPEQMLSRSSYDYYHDGDLAKIQKMLAERDSNPTHYTLTYRLRHKDGYFVWFETAFHVIKDYETGRTLEIHTTSRDINERIQEERAQKRNQRLAKASRLNTMEEMASGMAHEINQPLAAVINYTRGCARYLEKHGRDHDKKLLEIMEKAVAQAERAGEITHRLKSFFSKGRLYKAPEKINRLIKEVVNFLRKDIDANQTKIVYKFGRKLPILFIDKIQIQQVILNLIQNAMEAMMDTPPSKRQITIKTIYNNNTVEVIINDTGPGFSPEIVNKIYQPFFTTKPRGTGMGLPICRSIVEAHLGSFMVRSPKYNKEGWVCFVLPVTRRRAENTHE